MALCGSGAVRQWGCVAVLLHGKIQQAGGGDQALLPSPLAANLDTEDPGAMHGVAQIDGALARQLAVPEGKFCTNMTTASV